MTPEIMARVAPMFPVGRMGEPDDPARLVEWLVSDEGRWVTGQVLNTEGGFARWRPPADGRPPGSLRRTSVLLRSEPKRLRADLTGTGALVV